MVQAVPTQGGPNPVLPAAVPLAAGMDLDAPVGDDDVLLDYEDIHAPMDQSTG